MTNHVWPKARGGGDLVGHAAILSGKPPVETITWTQHHLSATDSKNLSRVLNLAEETYDKFKITEKRI